MIGPEPGGSEQPWAEEMLRLARAGGIKHGRVPDQFDELAEWDLFVLPTRREAFGLVLIEAMGMGLPVVATRIDGPREIVTPETGLLIDAEDPEALAAAILELAGDPDRRKAMGRPVGPGFSATSRWRNRPRRSTAPTSRQLRGDARHA